MQSQTRNRYASDVASILKPLEHGSHFLRRVHVLWNLSNSNSSCWGVLCAACHRLLPTPCNARCTLTKLESKLLGICRIELPFRALRARYKSGRRAGELAVGMKQSRSMPRSRSCVLRNGCFLAHMLRLAHQIECGHAIPLPTCVKPRTHICLQARERDRLQCFTIPSGR